MANTGNGKPLFFRPRARLVGILGEHLIRDASVGLLELVKNSYDADATEVVVGLYELADPEKTRITVRDNGVGMTGEVVLEHWLQPASGHKEEQKKAGQRSTRGRLPLGEKGVGRFAVHKLGKSLVMVTRAMGAEKELVVKINWDEFEKENQFLDQVPIDLGEREPTEFRGEATGTLLEMHEARERWREVDVNKVSQSLRRLMSPFKGVKDFRISLKCPEYAKYEDVSPSRILETAHATISGIVDEVGVLEFDYESKVPGFPENRVPDQREILVEGIRDWTPADRKSRCGPFFVSYYVWDRTPGVLAQSRVNAADLDALCGVSVYRDGIRVLPYGEPGDDWLKLDLRRINIPTRRIGNKNIMGFVEINQVENAGLKDKTNREGLIEGAAFADFQKLVAATVEVFERRWVEDKPVAQRKKTAAEATLKTVVAKLGEDVVKTENLKDALASMMKRVEEARAAGKPIPLEASLILEAAKPLEEAIGKFSETAKEVTKAADETTEEYENQRDLLLSLAGIGLAAERFTHEFARMTREASDTLVRLDRRVRPKVPDAREDLDNLKVVLEALRNDVLALGPLFYVRRAPKEREVNIERVVKNAAMLNRTPMQDHHIKFEIEVREPLAVRMREGQCTQVFNNLIDNAVFWLSRKSDQTERRLKVVVDGSRRTVVVSDNGPGVHPRYGPRIFEPFFSTKADGRGLGLYISREILSEKKATIDLVDAAEEPDAFRKGASFIIQFPAEVRTDGGDS